MSTETYSLQSVKVRGLRQPRWEVVLSGAVVDSFTTHADAHLWVERHSCQYSPVHTLRGVPATAVVDGGLLVGPVQACTECAA